MGELTLAQRTRKAIRWLRTNFPASRPVYVRWRTHLKSPYDRSQDVWAVVHNRKTHFDLHLNRQLLRQVELLDDTLIHEWAHVLEGMSHSDKWGRMYARIYRRWHGEDGFEDSLGGEC